MDVIALVGQSGTGKSHRALDVAYDNHADAIIDDGLLISGTKILAGTSAKNEANKIQAVKRAIFSDKNHVQSVKEAIEKHCPKRILIIGTSINMVDIIAAKLDIPKPSNYIMIESIANPKEIRQARHARLQEGKHVIPVPTVELKPHFSGYLIDSLSGMFSSNTRRHSRNPAEKSIVRPHFSYYGKMLIANSALRHIIKISLYKNPKIHKIISIDTKRWQERDSVDIKLYINAVYGYSLPTLTHEIQTVIKKNLEYLTGLYVHVVDVHINKLCKEKVEEKKNHAE